MTQAQWAVQAPAAITGTTQLTRGAIAHAIRAAFGASADPALLGVWLQPTFAGYRATLALANGGRSPGERRKWVEGQYYARWKALEELLGVRLHLRRTWIG